jgi:hypothetical protein
MTPEEHYAEAERLIGPDAVPQGVYGENYDHFRADNLAEAQVHATLFLGGAMLLAGAAGYDTARDRLADAVLGTQR